jgi:hypothetical protein
MKAASFRSMPGCSAIRNLVDQLASALSKALNFNFFYLPFLSFPHNACDESPDNIILRTGKYICTAVLDVGNDHTNHVSTQVYPSMVGGVNWALKVIN